MGGCGTTGGGDFHGGEVDAALAAPGSYYMATANDEGIIILVPRRNLAAYYYWG